jgi:hypothetical protein
MKTILFPCAFIAILLSSSPPVTAQEIEGKGMNVLFYKELNDKRIKQAVYEQMKNIGVTYKNDQPPLEMHCNIIIEDKTIFSD